MNSLIGKQADRSRSLEQGVFVVRLSKAEYSSLDADRLESIREMLLEIASDQVSSWLVLDVSAVHFFGAGFVSVLVDTWDRLRNSGRKLVLCGLTPYCL